MEFDAEGPKAIPLWINGHAFLTVCEQFFDVTNPATGEAIRRVPLCGAEEAAQAVASARAAQAVWQAMTAESRQAALERVATALDQYTGHFARLLKAESGADEAAATAEVAEAVATLQSGATGQAGVFALVLDPSRPLAHFAVVAAPLLRAGATLVIKPSPKAPSALFALCELSARAEWPAGVLNLLHGDAAAISGLCAAGIDRLVYAGEPALGAQVQAMAAAAGTAFENHA